MYIHTPAVYTQFCCTMTVNTCQHTLDAKINRALYVIPLDPLFQEVAVATCRLSLYHWQWLELWPTGKNHLQQPKTSTKTTYIHSVIDCAESLKAQHLSLIARAAICYCGWFSGPCARTAEWLVPGLTRLTHSQIKVFFQCPMQFQPDHTGHQWLRTNRTVHNYYSPTRKTITEKCECNRCVVDVNYISVNL